MPESEIQIPVQSRIAIQCNLKEYIETGDCYLYICQVEQVYGDGKVEGLCAWNGYSRLDLQKRSGGPEPAFKHR